MSLFRYLAFCFAIPALLGTPRIAAADPVPISSGVLLIGSVPDVLSRGFLRSISYDLAIDDFRIRWVESDGLRQDPLAPLLPTVAFWTPAGASEEIVFLDSRRFLVTATPSSSPTPFSLEGRLSFVAMSTGALLFDDVVSGSGIAAWSFTPDPAGTPLVWQVRYDFAGQSAPVPEPGTILLVGAGLAGALTRGRCLRSCRTRARPAQ